MNFSSPWKSRYFVKSVAVIRCFLRPLGNLEQKYIDHLTDTQNRRVHRHLAGTRPSAVLLIMPRCVKLSCCRADVQNSLSQCQDCRLCPLGDVARLCARFDIQALVAFRSQIAFELARKLQPDLIIATACHDRLVKALYSVPTYPALLAPLPRMQKKCVNAKVDLGWLEGQLVGLPRRDFTSKFPAPPVDAPISPITPAARAAEGS
ncbi:MAG: DUF116 domain-containing protein [Gemmatimonadales bacterium]|nr:DUF116 domain-containing protein [Gemmatimonadales bacterium]